MKKTTKQKQKKKKYLRVLTNSERSTFACQKKWAYRYEEGLTEYDTPNPLKHGSLVHEMLAYWYRGGMLAPMNEIEINVGRPWSEKREEFYAEYQGDVDEKRKEDEEILQLSLGMVDGHNEMYGERDREELEIIAVEATVACQISHPKTGRRLTDGSIIDGEKIRRNYVYGGQVDLLYRRRDNGAYGYMEHKTTIDGNLDNHVMQKVLFDPQTRGYALAAKYAIPHLSDIKPTDIREVTYNILRKKLPREPKLLKPKTKADKEAGRFAGISKAAIDTTPEIYEDFVRRNGFDVEDYRDFFERLDAQFYKRQTFSIGDIELKNLEKDLYYWALQVREASKPNAHHPRQVASCLGAGSYRCPYQMICMEDDELAKSAFNIQQNRHAELPGDLSEPWVAKQRAPRKEKQKQMLTFKKSSSKTHTPLDIDDDDFNNEW